MRCQLLALLLPAFALQDNEAEKLFRGVEKKLLEARSVRVSLEATLTAGGQDIPFKGALDLREGDKGRVEIKGGLGGAQMAIEVVADGKKLKVLATPPGKEREEAMPRTFRATFLKGLCRVGLTASALLVRLGGATDIEQTVPVSDFKFGKDARVGGRQARVLEYKVRLGKGAKTTAAKLWLDAKTLFPLKRELSAEMGGQPVQIVETYSDFTLNAQAGAAVPKS